MSFFFLTPGVANATVISNGKEKREITAQLEQVKRELEEFKEREKKQVDGAIDSERKVQVFFITNRSDELF